MPTKEPAGIERRKAKRFYIPLDVEYRTLTQNPIYGSVLVNDISKGGLSFVAKTALQKGMTVQLKMNVPGDNLPVFAMGTVAWADGLKSGVKLVKIARRDQERILEHIYRQWLKENDHHKQASRRIAR